MESLIGLTINRQDLLLYIWSLRNVYRFYVFLFSCVILLEKNDIDRIFEILYKFLIINCIICSYQYFILHLGQDFIGGTFGTEQGTNGYMNLFLTIMLAFAFTKYNNQEIKLSKMITIFIISLYIATISELKILYIEFVLILFAGILISKNNRKTIGLLIISGIFLYFTIQVLYVIYPPFANFFNVESIMKYSAKGGYSNKENLNRFTAIQTLDEKFFKDTSLKFIGFGSGSAEVSQFELLKSDFSKIYLEKLNYTWFSHAFLFIENGYLGILIYITFFVVIFIDNKFMKKEKKNGLWGYEFSQLIAILCLINFVYNASLRCEAAYLYFWSLSIGYIINKSNAKEVKNENINVSQLESKKM